MRWIIKSIWLCAVIILLSGKVFCQEKELVLDAPASVKLALENNLQVRGAQTTLTGRQLSRDNTWNEFLPVVTASTNLVRSNEESSMGALAAMIPGYEAPSQWNLQAALSIQLSLSWKNVTNIQKALL
ncbi:MAG: hypothetical protein EHM28_04745, partial [Spirochaetaceae bacterium]